METKRKKISDYLLNNTLTSAVSSAQNANSSHTTFVIILCILYPEMKFKFFIEKSKIGILTELPRPNEFVGKQCACDIYIARLFITITTYYRVMGHHKYQRNLLTFLGYVIVLGIFNLIQK